MQFINTDKQRTITSPDYRTSFVQPDQSRTIADLIERHIDLANYQDHSNQAVEDTNIDSPMRYDSELTDFPTKYQDKEFYDYQNSLRQKIGEGATDPNPRNLNPNEKVSTDTSKSVQSDRTIGEGA